MSVLMIDIGGSSVKTMVSDREEMRKFPSGPTLTPKQMVAGVKAATRDWTFDAITVGFPGLVENGQLVREPLNLGGGWLSFDLARAFDRPVRIINDAALHALASYEGGRMLFVGFGTSIGAALVADDVIVPVELGLVPFTKRHRFMTRLTKQARKESGHKRWQRSVHEAVELLQDIFWPRDTVIGGGNAKHLDPLPAGARRVSNQDGIVGARRLWEGADYFAVPYGTTWRISKDSAPPGSPTSQAIASSRAARKLRTSG
jgi:polyphosphate glucokinase